MLCRWETTVTKIHNDIIMMIDSKSNVVLLLLDLSAAFDTIKHNPLLTKLKNVYGITELALSWLQCNLNNCTFKVKVKKPHFLNAVLILVYLKLSRIHFRTTTVNILMPEILKEIVTKYGFLIHLYADDTQVYFAFDFHRSNPDITAAKNFFLEIKP